MHLKIGQWLPLDALAAGGLGSTAWMTVRSKAGYRFFMPIFNGV
jgi:hypothetical protein